MASANETKFESTAVLLAPVQTRGLSADAPEFKVAEVRTQLNAGAAEFQVAAVKAPENRPVSHLELDTWRANQIPDTLPSHQSNEEQGKETVTMNNAMSGPMGYKVTKPSVAAEREPRDGEISRQIWIPTGKCGLIIGRNGSLITRMQNDTGCRLISCGHKSEDALGLRPIFLIGIPENTNKAENLIWKCINESANRPTETAYHDQVQIPEFIYQVQAPTLDCHIRSLLENLTSLVTVFCQNPDFQTLISLQGVTYNISASNLGPLEKAVSELQVMLVQMAGPSDGTLLSMTAPTQDSFMQTAVSAQQTLVGVPETRDMASETEPEYITIQPENTDDEGHGSGTQNSTENEGETSSLAHEYESLEFLPGHYMPKDAIKELMSRLDISGQIRRNDLIELVKLLQENYAPENDITTLFADLKSRAEEYCPSEDAARLINSFRVPDIYVPTPDERASYHAILQTVKDCNSQSTAKDLKNCYRALTKENERLRIICNDLAKWIHSMQNGNDKVCVLEKRNNDLKMENFAKDSLLQQLRNQIENLLVKIDDDLFTKEHVVKEYQVGMQALENVVASVCLEKDEYMKTNAVLLKRNAVLEAGRVQAASDAEDDKQSKTRLSTRISKLENEFERVTEICNRLTHEKEVQVEIQEEIQRQNDALNEETKRQFQEIEELRREICNTRLDLQISQSTNKEQQTVIAKLNEELKAGIQYSFLEAEFGEEARSKWV